MTKKLIPTERMRDQLMMQSKAKGGSVIKQLEDYLRERKGEYGVKRLQRAADEIPGLESMYTLDALKRAFGGDNAKALMSMNPADFEKFAIPLESHVRASSMTQPEYIKHLAQLKGGFADVPFLEVGREYPKALLNIQGHEGRHRSRALAGKNVKKSLVNLFPTASMRESMPRRSQEEFIEAMKKELGKERFVSPEGTGTLPRDLTDPIHKKIEERGILEVNRPQLPDIYAKGGNVDRMRDHMMVRGLAGNEQIPSIDTMKLALTMKASGGGVSLPGFFSPVDQALDTVQSKGTGQQILSQLSKAPNVKPDELKDRGIDAALRARPKITKEELKDMAKAMSAPRIKEIHRHGSSGKKFIIEESPYGGFEVLDEYSEPVKRFGDYYEAQDHADKLMHGDSKYEEYQLPGGKNYRETTLSLDTGKKRPSTKIWEVMDETGRVFSHTDNPQTAERWKRTYPNRVREKDIASSLDKPPQGMFVSGHWDEPNVLLHYRTNDRTDANGKKVLFIEELQSDLATALREHSSKKESGSNPPPALPFTTSTDKWLNLALKHIIHRAAKEGYDRVAFINGEQSHERFPQKKDGSSTRGAFSSFYGEPTGEVVNDNEEPQKGKSPMLHTALNKILPKIKGGKLSHVMLPHIRQTAVPMNSPQVGFDITPEMREHIKTKGLPLYHSGGLI